MSVLSDSIELFIHELMGASGEISLQRNELAQHFDCAPSQINYVLATRFTLTRGYLTVSRRGGGGYIRVVRIGTDGLLYDLASEAIGDKISPRDAAGIIARLHRENIITEREARMMAAGMDGCALPTQQMGDAARARVLKSMLTALLHYSSNEA